MAIEFVQKSVKKDSNVNSTTIALTGVTAGNFLVLAYSVWKSGGPGNGTPTDSLGNTWNTTTPSPNNSGGRAYVSYAMNVLGGDTTVTLDTDASGAEYYNISFSEWSGIKTTGALDVESSDSGTSVSPVSGTTGVPAQDDSLVIVSVMATQTGVSDMGFDLPAGFTNLYLRQNSVSEIAHSSDYKIITAAAAQSASWGTITGAYPWSGKIAVFAGQVAASHTRRLVHSVEGGW